MENELPPSPEAGTKGKGPVRRLVRVVLWSLLVLLLLASGFLPLLIETVFHLLFGWLSFLWRNLGEIRFVPDRIAMALLLGALALAGLHFLARAWWRRARPGSVWRWGWSAAIASSLLACALAAISVAGAAHQLAWLKSEPKMELYGSLFHSTKMSNNMRQLALLLIGYAADHEGRFPDNIAEAVSVEDDERHRMALMLFSETQHATPEPWLYFGSGRSEDDARLRLLLASPRPSNGKRLVVMQDEKLHFIDDMDEETFQALIQEQKRALQPAGDQGSREQP